MKIAVVSCWMVLAALVAGMACDGGDEQETGGAGEAGEVEVPVPFEVAAFNFTISGECQAVMEITELGLLRGQEVTYCNKWDQMATLTFGAPGFLPGDATSVTLAVGECITHVVAADVDLGSNTTWSLNCQGYSGPMGGGPVKVQDPPPSGP